MPHHICDDLSVPPSLLVMLVCSIQYDRVCVCMCERCAFEVTVFFVDPRDGTWRLGNNTCEHNANTLSVSHVCVIVCIEYIIFMSAGTLLWRLWCAIASICMLSCWFGWYTSPQSTNARTLMHETARIATTTENLFACRRVSLTPSPEPTRTRQEKGECAPTQCLCVFVAVP